MTLYLCTIPLFFVTRSVAARNRQLNIETAAAWYAKGQEQLKSGDLTGAVASFRKAATSDHDNPRNVLALTTALTASDHDEEARQMLLQIRASEPESAEINLQLARLSAKQRRDQEAVRYYHYALDGIEPETETADQNRRIRTELVHFLLRAGDQARALSEMLILSADIPNTSEEHNEVGNLFLEAMDWQRALEQFTLVLSTDKGNGPALLGAGQASFQLGDYRNASRYLRNASQGGHGDSSADLMRETAELVLSEDPLAAGLTTEERIRRLSEALNSASQRLQGCLSMSNNPADVEILQNLDNELHAGIKTRFRSAELRQEADGFRSGVELILRAEAALEMQACPGNSPAHQALVLIAKKHGAVER